MYKLLALDIDGTLLNSQGQVDDSTIEAIRRVKKEDVLVTISTGRPIQGVYKYIEMLDLDGPIITYNGGMIVDAKTNEVIYSKALDGVDAKMVYQLGLSYHTTMIVWSNNRLYVNRQDDHVKDYQKLSGEEPIVIDDFSQVLKQGITKILWINKPENLLVFQKEIGGEIRDSVTYCTSKAHYLEFFNADVSKAKALEFIGQKLSITKEEMIAIGDGNNDIDMIDYVGMGVAMENATDHVKGVANYITSSHDDRGIFKALEKLI